jgi:hypothetical protein
MRASSALAYPARERSIAVRDCSGQTILEVGSAESYLKIETRGHFEGQRRP